MCNVVSFFFFFLSLFFNELSFCSTGELHLDGDFKSTKLKLTWLPKVELVDTVLVYVSNLITKESLQKTDDINLHVNRNIKKEVQCFPSIDLPLYLSISLPPLSIVVLSDACVW